MARTIRSQVLGQVPHAFLDGPQSDSQAFDLVAHGTGPVLANQVHSALALAVDGPFAGDPPKVDALVTATRGLALGIRTADCAPVLLADAAAGVIGAAHAGWRGAQGGVIAATVAAMVKLGSAPERISAAIGPCIAQASYEVDAPFREHFSAADERFFVPARAGHWQFDLEEYVAQQLAQCGVGRIDRLRLDTYADRARFHSFRRATHRGEAGQGRQISLIALAV